MQPTPYSTINAIIESLLAQMQSILGSKLVGLYLDGSLVIGDFDPIVSDIDLIAALSSEVDDKEFAALQKMHEDFAASHKAWDDRIEICYISVAALNTVRTQTSMIVNISPGEPFHRRESSREWLVSWYVVREKGKTLFGPPPQAVIEPISQAEFLQSVRENALSWRTWVQDMHRRKQQAYAILTLCRALYTSINGEQVSKKQAALWAAQQLPQWSSLILNAMEWRKAPRDEDRVDEAMFQETQRFVNVMVDRILSI